MKSTSSIGPIRNLSTKYAEIRRNVIFNDVKKISPNNSESLINDQGKMSLIPIPKNELELPNWKLPPKYMEKFDIANDIINEVSIKFNKLIEDQQRRIMPKFDDEENKLLDKQIRLNTHEMTKKLKECEEIIKEISFEKIENLQESTIRENMKINISTKLRDFTKKFKINEETYMNKYKELVGDETKYTNNYDKNEDGFIESNQAQMEGGNEVLMKRDKEISTLVSSINELATIFKDMQTLVLEQGTILDRIDYNIDNAVQSTKKAVNELKKADDNMKSNCARNANMLLMVLIFVFSLLIILKLTR